MLETINYSLSIDQRPTWESTVKQMKLLSVIAQAESISFAKLGRFACITVKGDESAIQHFESTFPVALHSDL